MVYLHCGQGFREAEKIKRLLLNFKYENNFLSTLVVQPIRDSFDAPNLEGGVKESALTRDKEQCKTMLVQIAGDLYIWSLQRNAPPFCHLH